MNEERKVAVELEQQVYSPDKSATRTNYTHIGNQSSEAKLMGSFAVEFDPMERQNQANRKTATTATNSIYQSSRKSSVVGEE